jgi:hypothetical protein
MARAPRGPDFRPARCPQRDSNPRYGLERAATWAASRWGPGEPRIAGRILGTSGPLAQLVEQGTFNPKVAGSSPARPTRIPARSDCLPHAVAVVPARRRPVYSCERRNTEHLRLSIRKAFQTFGARGCQHYASALHADEAIGECVFPHRQARTGALPRVDRLRVGSRPLGDPREQLERRGCNGGHDQRYGVVAAGSPPPTVRARRRASSRRR